MYRAVLEPGIINAAGQGLGIKSKGISTRRMYFIYRYADQPARSVKYLDHSIATAGDIGNGGKIIKRIG